MLTGPPEAPGGFDGRSRLFKFLLWRAEPGGSEIRRVPLCEECARRLEVLVWTFMDGRVLVNEMQRCPPRVM
jgi:hypothetical protein